MPVEVKVKTGEAEIDDSQNIFNDSIDNLNLSPTDSTDVVAAAPATAAAAPTPKHAARAPEAVSDKSDSPSSDTTAVFPAGDGDRGEELNDVNVKRFAEVARVSIKEVVSRLLTSIMCKYNREKADAVPALMCKYEGSEIKLLITALRKYISGEVIDQATARATIDSLGTSSTTRPELVRSGGADGRDCASHEVRAAYLTRSGLPEEQQVFAYGELLRDVHAQFGVRLPCRWPPDPPPWPAGSRSGAASWRTAFMERVMDVIRCLAKQPPSPLPEQLLKRHPKRQGAAIKRQACLARGNIVPAALAMSTIAGTQRGQHVERDSTETSSPVRWSAPNADRLHGEFEDFRRWILQFA